MIRRLVLTILIAASPAAAELKLAALFSDHAVLQADMETPVWGWADAGATVTIKCGERDATARADEKGKWLAKLPAAKASAAPVELLVTSGSEQLKRQDILIGEVWIGSGQSNMAMALARTSDADAAIKSANHPQIRLFQVARNAADEPASDVDGGWVVCTPETVKTFSATLYHFGLKLHESLNAPVGLIHSSWGGTPIQAWTPADAFADQSEIAAERARSEATYRSPPATNPRSPETRTQRDTRHLRPTLLYNGMIAPLIPYGIRGVTWYQGENNVHQNDVEKYAGRMQAMVASWRAKWGEGDWPFLFVQIAPYGKYRGHPESLPLMWEQQTRALSMISNSGMAATGDIGDVNDIHPKNKKDVGNRLALLALVRTYHVPDVVCDAPRYQSHAVEGAKIRVKFDGAGSGLATSDDKEPTDFEIAAADGKFVKATARIDGNDVLVWSDDVKNSMAVRFAWSPTAKANLTNSAGLPAIAFRSK